MDAVPRQEYEYALSNFRIAHLKVAEQKTQLDEQERQISLLRARIALLEGGDDEPRHTTNRAGGSSVDDFSIRNAASQLERLINRWAAEMTNTSQMPLDQMRELIFSDVAQGPAHPPPNATPVQVQNLLRHLMSDTICEGLVNCLVVTSSNEANIQLTRIHEHIFARDATVASVWRRQTYSAAVENCTPDMMRHVLMEHAPSLLEAIAPGGKSLTDSLMSILNGAYNFSKMLHGSRASSGGGGGGNRSDTQGRMRHNSDRIPRNYSASIMWSKSSRSDNKCYRVLGTYQPSAYT
ncbi:hypothetical protein RSAG8_01247, partial [Rhizoctonia solani AG-8 WAC10335]